MRASKVSNQNLKKSKFAPRESSSVLSQASKRTASYKKNDSLINVNQGSPRPIQGIIRNGVQVLVKNNKSPSPL